MPLFDPSGSSTLEDALGQQATAASANLKDSYTQTKRRLVSQQAASGRLGSGVADYPLTDLDTSYTQGQSGIQDQLASSLAGIPSEDWLNTNQFNRQLGLANQIGAMNRPSTLDEIFQGIGSVSKLGGNLAAIGAMA